MNNTQKIKTHLSQMQPASRTEGMIPVGTLASGNPFGIPYVLLRGAQNGKTLWIYGQVHGNEVTGIVAALDFLNGLDPQDMTGNIVFTGTGIPQGMDARQKGAPQDNADLDQSFPGRADGFFTDRLAYAQFEEIRAVKPDLLINMHTQGSQTIARSYTVFKEHPDGGVAPQALYPAMAAFEPMVACRMSLQRGQGELPGDIAGALDYQLLNIGIPAFMVELGVGQRAEAADVDQGVRGFTDVARQLGILPGAPRARSSLRRVTRRGHATVSHGGLFRPSRRPGDIVKAGEPMGEVMNIFGQVVERPALPSDALIIAIRVDPVMHSGDRFGYFAYEWEDVAVS